LCVANILHANGSQGAKPARLVQPPLKRSSPWCKAEFDLEVAIFLWVHDLHWRSPLQIFLCASNQAELLLLEISENRRGFA
jgi:hypothetical protein